MSSPAERMAARFGAATTDAALLEVGLHLEEVTALAYRALRDGGPEFAARFERHEREHAAAFETLLEALTVPVRRHAGPADLDALVPELRTARGSAALELLGELEGAAIAGHQVMARRLELLDALRTVASVTAGAAQHLVVIRDALRREPTSEAFESGR